MYKGIIVRLENVRPHPNADKILLANAKGYQVVVGLESKDGDLMALFPPDGKFSDEYGEKNDLVGYTDEFGNRRGGFFAKNLRIRSQNFRGEKSEAYVAPLKSFEYTGIDISTLSEGMVFDELNGHKICEKYFTPATQGIRGNKLVKKQNKYFPKHVDTEQLRFFIDSIPDKSIIYISEKLHGTSGRYAYVLEEREIKRSFFQRLLRKPAYKVSEYVHLAGTRNVTLDGDKEDGFYEGDPFRFNVFDKFKDLMTNGECIYGEIVGYTNNGQPIMSDQDTSELKDIKKKYGKTMRYSYGQIPGTCEFYVYRITRTNEDGDIVELSWPQMCKRAKELGIKVVPHFAVFIHNIFLDQLTEIGYLQSIVDQYISGPSTLDESHIREGVVVRVEQPDGETKWYKSKSFEFGVLEGYLKNNEDAIDLEEIS